MHLDGDLEVLWELSLLPKNTTQLPVMSDSLVGARTLDHSSSQSQAH